MVQARKSAFWIAATMIIGQLGVEPALAENKMGYQMLSQQVAARLSPAGGSLGVDVERSQQITDDGMTFDIIRVKAVRRGSPAAQAGLKAGDQVIAVDGRVFESLRTFAAYVGSIEPGMKVAVDYIPANGGPAQAQRVAVTVGAANGRAQAQSSPGMSTGTKIAIGVGAAALLGCYEIGCFSHRPAAQPNPAANR